MGTSQPLSGKSDVESFLAGSWYNLLSRDQSLMQKETGNHEKAKGSREGRNRGRPVPNLAWLPLGWERITKPRTSGQNDTFYREIETNRMLRSSYDVTCYLEFGKVIKKDKERIKPLLEAKYGLRFPKERKRAVVLGESLGDSEATFVDQAKTAT